MRGLQPDPVMLQINESHEISAGEEPEGNNADFFAKSFQNITKTFTCNLSRLYVLCTPGTDITYRIRKCNP